MIHDPFLHLIDTELARFVSSQALAVRGEWTTTSRRTYKSESQLGTGSAPFVEVLDARWTGTLTSPCDVGVLLFLVTQGHVHWVKASLIAPTLPLSVSLHAYANSSPDAATFAASVAGAHLPTVPVSAARQLTESCSLGPDCVATGRVTLLAQAGAAAFYFIVLPASMLKVVRNHLWRVRDGVASALSPEVREVLTRRRSGVFEVARG